MIGVIHAYQISCTNVILNINNGTAIIDPSDQAGYLATKLP